MYKITRTCFKMGSLGSRCTSVQRTTLIAYAPGTVEHAHAQETFTRNFRKTRHYILMQVTCAGKVGPNKKSLRKKARRLCKFLVEFDFY